METTKLKKETYKKIIEDYENLIDEYETQIDTLKTKIKELEELQNFFLQQLEDKNETLEMAEEPTPNGTANIPEP